MIRVIQLCEEGLCMEEASASIRALHGRRRHLCPAHVEDLRKRTEGYANSTGRTVESVLQAIDLRPLVVAVLLAAIALLAGCIGQPFQVGEDLAAGDGAMQADAAGDGGLLEDARAIGLDAAPGPDVDAAGDGGLLEDARAIGLDAAPGPDAGALEDGPNSPPRCEPSACPSCGAAAPCCRSSGACGCSAFAGVCQ